MMEIKFVAYKPKSTKIELVQVGIQLDKDLRDSFRAVAREKHMTMSGYIKRLMADAIKQHSEEMK